MKTEEKLLREELAIFVEKMKKAGIDVTKIKKPTDAQTSIGQMTTYTPHTSDFIISH